MAEVLDLTSRELVEGSIRGFGGLRSGHAGTRSQFDRRAGELNADHRALAPAHIGGADKALRHEHKIDTLRHRVALPKDETRARLRQVGYFAILEARQIGRGELRWLM
jgi:hypothetical protein